MILFWIVIDFHWELLYIYDKKKCKLVFFLSLFCHILNFIKLKKESHKLIIFENIENNKLYYFI